MVTGKRRGPELPRPVSEGRVPRCCAAGQFVTEQRPVAFETPVSKADDKASPTLLLTAELAAFLVFIHIHVTAEVWTTRMGEVGGSAPRFIPEPTGALVSAGPRAQPAGSSARLPSASSLWVPCR